MGTVTLAGKTIEVDEDWADTLTLIYVMNDIQKDDHRFYGIENGQSTILFYLDAPSATTLNQLTNNALQPMLRFTTHAA